VFVTKLLWPNRGGRQGFELFPELAADQDADAKG
jgi:hypothetical protein